MRTYAPLDYVFLLGSVTGRERLEGTEQFEETVQALRDRVSRATVPDRRRAILELFDAGAQMFYEVQRQETRTGMGESIDEAVASPDAKVNLDAETINVFFALDRSAYRGDGNACREIQWRDEFPQRIVVPND